MQTRVNSLLAILCSSFLAVAQAQAQDAPDDGWRFLVQPYVMFPNMHGRTAIGSLPAIDISEDPGDIFENLQMGAMFYAEARNQSWTLSTDLLYMDLAADMSADNPLTFLEGEVEVSQLGWELALLRRITRSFELGVGVTYNRIDADARLTIETPFGSNDLGAGLKEEWFDPTIVARSTRPLTDKWFFQARGNIGGFGAGSELMWQLQVDLGYRPSDSWLFTFGYRYIDVDYDQGTGDDRFVYDMQTFGPQLKLGFNF